MDNEMELGDEVQAVMGNEVETLIREIGENGEIDDQLAGEGVATEAEV